MKNNIELLSPAGDFECLKAAVQNGADAVYFGGSLFNARSSASNFDEEDLKTAINYCTLRNVKTHLTLNTLIKNSEFYEASQLAEYAYKLGIDALIVQDFGLAKYLIKQFPDLPIHASTQMSIHNLEGVLEAEKAGFKRVVLSRELPAHEIEYICKNSNVEIESFIHGALCICYSGQCLFSSIVGGRSGNRGRCAQPCRLPYELVSKDNDTNKISSIDKGFLLSPRDLCGLDYLPTLIKAGVKCFKIEGRMKTPEYVATVTRIYRKYIDMVLNNEKYIVDEQDIKELMQVFNRGGFSKGHLDSEPNRNLICKDKSNNMGLYLGNVANYNKNKGHITLNLNENLAIGDVVSFEKEPSKYTVSELMIGNRNLSTCEKDKKVTIGRMKGNISIGDKIYKLESKELLSNAEKSYKNVENKKIALNCEVIIKKDQPISMKIFTNKSHKHDIYSNIEINVVSNITPIEALKTPISVERVIKQISKTNNTPYFFENIKVLLDDGLYVPSVSTLNELRRNALEQLENTIINKKTRINISLGSLTPLNKNTNNHQYELLDHPKISLSLRHLYKQYDYSKLDKEKIDKIYLALKLFVNKEYKDIIKYLSENYDLYIYMPTIIKSNYKNIVLNDVDGIIEKYNIKGFVISNLADFELLKKYKENYVFVGNYSLNIFNSFSINEYVKLGLNRVTLSRELNKDGLNEILNSSNIDSELIIYGNLPVMATNYCFLGKTNLCYPTCGLNCKKDSTYYLMDRLGYTFRIIPDNIQTVTLIFNSKTLSTSTRDISINHVRLDILDETIEEINQVLQVAYNREKLEGNRYTNGNLNREV